MDFSSLPDGAQLRAETWHGKVELDPSRPPEEGRVIGHGFDDTRFRLIYDESWEWVPERDGFRFYLDYHDDHDALTCFAMWERRGAYADGFGACVARDNAEVEWQRVPFSTIGPEIPKPIARKIHPSLITATNEYDE